MIELSQLAVFSPLSYLIVFAIPALDAILPVLPSETVVIALGVATAGSADPRIAVLGTLAACGAFAGDNLGYILGRRFAPAAERRFFAGQRGSRRRAWAEGVLDRFGVLVIIVCRFLPGGRTAVTLTCGIVGYRRSAFVAATACAGVIWAGYAFFIGRLGGQTFADRPWAGLLLALGASLVLSAVAELLRRTRPWRWLGRVRSVDRAAGAAAHHGDRVSGGAAAHHGERVSGPAGLPDLASTLSPQQLHRPCAPSCCPGEDRPGRAEEAKVDHHRFPGVGSVADIRGRPRGGGLARAAQPHGLPAQTRPPVRDSRRAVSWRSRLTG
jgi:membrane-associated protein